MKKFSLSEVKLVFLFFWGLLTLSPFLLFSKEPFYHTVKKGETLEIIAKTYGVSIEELKRVNNLKNNKLKVGQKLLIKPREVSKEKSKESSLVKNKVFKEPFYHTVKKGETLEIIAKTYGVSIEELKRVNNLKNNKLKVGQKLLIISEKIKGEEREQRKEKVSEKMDKDEELVSEIEKSLKELEDRINKLNARSSRSKKAWLEIINEYRRLYLLYPGSKYASKCLLKMADLHYKLYKDFGSKKDLDEAIKRYETLVHKYPKSEETEQASYNLAQIYKKDLHHLEKAKFWEERLEREYPKSKYLISLKEASKVSKKEVKKPPDSKIVQKENSKKEDEKVSNQTSQQLSKKELSLRVDKKKITQIKPISGEDYTRIIIESSGQVEYQANILKESKDKPPRIYIDLFPATVESSVPKELAIKDAHLTKIRVGQFDKNTVRVVLDLNSLSSYKIFSLKDPYQLILDLVGKEREEVPKTLASVKTFKRKEISKKSLTNSSSQDYINLARQLGLGVRRIVIDPGHGGEDPGAVNSFNDMKEKEIVLKLAKILAEKLQKELGVEVILTRDKDVFIPLTQRPAIANSKKADLFISLHLNASPDPKAKGVETYYLNFTTDPEAIKVAALENAMSDKGISDLYDLVKAVLANTKLSESKLLAERVQKELVKTLSRYYPYIEDRGVKYAPFLVLVGTRMPAILVEAGFISNPSEAELFKKEEFLEKIADGIVKGVEAYVQSLKFSLSTSKDKHKGS